MRTTQDSAQNAQIANWNGHTFEVGPKLIRGFTGLTIKGKCETTTKNSDKQKYVEHKYGEIPEIGMTVELNALTGVTDVYKEAMTFVKEATEGATAYFYLGTSKLIPAKVMLTSAEVVQVVHMPGRGDVWINCQVKLTFKQGTKNDSGKSGGGSGGGSGSGTGGSKKTSVKTAGTVGIVAGAMAAIGASVLPVGSVGKVAGAMAAIGTGINLAKGVVSAAQSISKPLKIQGSGLAYRKAEVDRVTNKAPKTTKDSAVKKNVTTGKPTFCGAGKITRVALE